MNTPLLRTPLYAWHVAHQARVVDFGGWEMPVQYSSIVEEHQATRRAVGIFDISHMGRLRFDGPGRAAFLDRLLTRRVARLAEGKIRYSLVTNEAGGILDDVLIYALRDTDGRPFHLLVVNASNRTKIVEWIERQLRADEDVQMTDQTLETAMISVQGPRALATVGDWISVPLEPMEYYTGTMATIAGVPGIVSRTGYTGEDGCELIVPAAAAEAIWERCLRSGESAGIRPVGLGARDTLRLEAAMPLYGHELSEQLNPYQAGLSFAVQLDHEFIGRAALEQVKASPPTTCRIGLEMSGKRVPREHYGVLAGNDRVGEVSSGTFSPTLEKPIAMAYVPPEHAAAGTDLFIDIRGKREPARVVALPFYRRPRGQVA
ncbi:MAG: glycine cleavage system aminomethyltransferase GcvT [Pirellulaceae bacterium]